MCDRLSRFRRVEMMFEKENLRAKRSYALQILRRRRGSLSSEAAATVLLDVRWRFILPLVEQNAPEHPYSVFSTRLVRLATGMMGEEWVEDYLKKQKTTRR